MKGDGGVFIRVGPLFRKKLNLMRHWNDYPSITRFTNDLAQNNEFEELMLRMKEKRKNETFKI